MTKRRICILSNRPLVAKLLKLHTPGIEMKPASDFHAQRAERLARLKLDVADFEEKFSRSSGPGGQHVNKVSTAVMLRHVPSGVSVTVQDTRSQSMNRQLAWTRLMDAIEPDLVHRVEHALLETPGVLAVSQVQLRWVGHRLQGAGSVTLDEMPLSDADGVAHAAAALVRAEVPNVDSFQVRPIPVPSRP